MTRTHSTKMANDPASFGFHKIQRSYNQGGCTCSWTASKPTWMRLQLYTCSTSRRACMTGPPFWLFIYRKNKWTCAASNTWSLGQSNPPRQASEVETVEKCSQVGFQMDFYSYLTQLMRTCSQNHWEVPKDLQSLRLSFVRECKPDREEATKMTLDSDLLLILSNNLKRKKFSIYYYTVWVAKSCVSNCLIAYGIA